jgi:hypothetical protein
MAIRITSWLWYQNNVLRPLLKRDRERGFSYLDITPDDRERLDRYVESLLEIRDESSNVEKICVLLCSVHDVVRNYVVPTSIYDGMGEVFEELRVRPYADLEDAIACSRRLQAWAACDPSQAKVINWEARVRSGRTMVNRNKKR